MTAKNRLTRPSEGWPLSSIPEGAHAAISTWLDALVTWNAKIDLTAARSVDELVDLMIEDARELAVMPEIARGATLVDVGSGAGAPGLALAILRPDLRVTLVEPLAKRTSFLRTVAMSLGRADVAIENARGEDLVGRSWDIAISRATLPPEPWISLGGSIAEGVWLFFAREEPPARVDASASATSQKDAKGRHFSLKKRVDYTWPRTSASRGLALYRGTA